MCLTWVAFGRGWRNAAPTAWPAARAASLAAACPASRASRAARWAAHALSRSPLVRSIDGRSWALVPRPFTFEDRQCWPGARHRVAGDLSEFGQAEFDCGGVIRHGVILLHRGRPLNETPVSRCASGDGDPVNIRRVAHAQAE